ncbi:MAG TPA: YceI family protein [Candidatus Dormibacteraeota bacterium]|nr:YceI family protein [Candidatus Dormibacteraeota bacterium]
MTWTIDQAHTNLGFSVRHMGLSTVRGKFTRFSGTIDLDPIDLNRATGEVEIEAASIETGQADRDTHLKSADFFDVDKFPKITFKAKRVSGSGDSLKVTGDLTIKDVTREVEFDYEHAGEGQDPYGNRKVGGALTGSINRGDFGLTWNVALEAGGLLVSDKIKIEVEGQLAESREAIEREVPAEAAV